MKISISYSWKNKDIVDIIDNDWGAIGIPLIRDERDLVFKKNIKEFMRNVNDVDFVLLVISKGYLESKNCMYEALEMLKDDKFLERVLPIVLDDAHISDPHGRLTYINFWENEIERLNEAIKSTKIIGKLKSIQEDLDHLVDIRNSIDTFLNGILNIRYLTWQEAKKNLGVTPLSA